jgi:hypothetical protein
MHNRLIARDRYVLVPLGNTVLQGS